MLGFYILPFLQKKTTFCNKYTIVFAVYTTKNCSEQKYISKKQFWFRHFSQSKSTKWKTRGKKQWKKKKGKIPEEKDDARETMPILCYTHHSLDWVYQPTKHKIGL